MLKVFHPQQFFIPQEFFNLKKLIKIPIIFGNSLKSPEFKLKIWDFLIIDFSIYCINFRIRVW